PFAGRASRSARVHRVRDLLVRLPVALTAARSDPGIAPQALVPAPVGRTLLSDTRRCTHRRVSSEPQMQRTAEYRRPCRTRVSDPPNSFSEQRAVAEFGNLARIAAT